MTSAVRQINQAGELLIKSYESLRLEAYQDGGGVWTIGYGHTLTARPGMKITEAQALQLFREDVRRASRWVTKFIRVPLTDNQFAVLTSFVFNLGGGALQSSTLRLRLNAGRYNLVAALIAKPQMVMHPGWKDAVTVHFSGEILKWYYDNGKPIRGLLRRRNAEAALWCA